MELKDFVEKFAEQFDDTAVELFTPETEFKELDEWSSLTALSVIAMVDDEYGKNIKGDLIRNSKTIQDLFDKINAI